MRNRIPINKGLDTQSYHNKIIDFFNRDTSGEEENEDLNDNFISNMDPNDPCINTKMVEEEICGYNNPSCSDLFGSVANQMSEPPSKCKCRKCVRT